MAQPTNGKVSGLGVESIWIPRKAIAVSVLSLSPSIESQWKIAVGLSSDRLSTALSIWTSAAGSLGAIVRKTSNNECYILSNNHVMANTNGASVGDDILHPGPADGGGSAIADLTDFEPILFDGSANTMDAAIAKVRIVSDVTGTTGPGGYGTPGTTRWRPPSGSACRSTTARPY